ncbi:hypothetical protein D3C78_1726110 [compost metagenome]
MLGACGQLDGIDAVGLQAFLDQQVLLHQVAGIEGIGEGEQCRGKGEQQDQAAQIETQQGSEGRHCGAGEVNPWKACDLITSASLPPVAPAADQVAPAMTTRLRPWCLAA